MGEKGAVTRGVVLITTHRGEGSCVRVGERSIGQHIERLGNGFGRSDETSTGPIGLIIQGSSSFEKGLQSLLDWVVGRLLGGVEGLHLGIQVLAESGLGGEVIPFPLTSLVCGSAVGNANWFSEEPTFDLSNAGFANAEEVGELLGLGIRSVRLEGKK